MNGGHGKNQLKVNDLVTWKQETSTQKSRFKTEIIHSTHDQRIGIVTGKQIGRAHV